MNWIMLIIAGLCEVGFASCLGKARTAQGTEATLWMTGFFLFLTVSMFLLYKATQTLPIGTAYAVWTGIGAVGTVIVGIVFFKEPADLWRMIFLTTLIGSIIGLKVISTQTN
ncbi:MAG: multidrug efflux SMR transporter [Bacteroidetes bacterium]|nr:multidrug efflux SMR transporter [Bacteroidota bacterium]